MPENEVLKFNHLKWIYQSTFILRMNQWEVAYDLRHDAN